MECIVNKPYPEIKVECENKNYAEILMQDYSGIVSETTAIFQYSYQFIDKFNDKEFYETIENISIVEMKHLEILGKLIKLLGVNPVFKSNYNNYLTYWSSSFLDYNTNIVDMIKIDIKGEEDAIKNYVYHASIINDKYIKEILYRIVEDEKKHIECLNVLLNKYSN